MGKPVESYVGETIGSLVLQLAQLQKKYDDAQEEIKSLITKVEEYVNAVNKSKGGV